MEVNRKHKLLLVCKLAKGYFHKYYCYNFRQDGKLILSGMGGLNNDSSVILWSSEKRDVSCVFLLHFLNTFLFFFEFAKSVESLMLFCDFIFSINFVFIARFLPSRK